MLRPTQMKIIRLCGFFLSMKGFYFKRLHVPNSLGQEYFGVIVHDKRACQQFSGFSFLFSVKIDYANKFLARQTHIFYEG